jgi:hypothetical protein
MNAHSRIFLASLVAWLLAGCGGGGDSAATADAPVAATTADAAPAEASAHPPADATIFEDDGANTGSLSKLRADIAALDTTTGSSDDFEGSFNPVPSGWSIVWWGTKPSYTVQRESREGYAHAGSGALLMQVKKVPADSGMQLVRAYPFANGQAYSAGAYLRTDATGGAVVEVQIRRNAKPYQVIASKRVTLTTAWQRVAVEGTYPFSDAGSLRVVPSSVGAAIYLDDVSVTPIASKAESASTGTTLPAWGGAETQTTTLKSYAMDEDFDKFAPGWTYNAWGNTTPIKWAAGRETAAGYVQSGAASQKFQVLDKGGGEIHLISKFAFVKGKTYRASLYLRSDQSTPVLVAMRRDANPYDNFASKNVTLNTSWQRVEIEGTYPSDVAGSLRVALKNATGTVWVDNVTIASVERNDMAPYSTATVSDKLFGMHINKLGSHYNWPGMGTRIIRLWNTGTTWRDVEPTNNGWNWTSGGGYRLDMYVNFITRTQPGTAILYTLGQTPQWASSTPTVDGLYGMGASGAPTNLEDWRDYVRVLARRYAGKIRYWELWNEPDYAPHWAGSTATLVEMARIAREELLAADPNNKLVSPGLTKGQGMQALDRYLSAGMGEHVDIIGYHWYYWTDPESLGGLIDNTRTLMKTYGVDNKPLWNTEGAFKCDVNVTDCSSVTATTAQIRSVNARAMFMMAVKGVANFNFHFWESSEPYKKLVESDFVTQTDASRTFAEARSWAQGAQVVDGFRTADGVYGVRLRRGSTDAFAIWSTKADTVVNLPAEWTVSRMRTLDGAESTVPSSRQITLGLEPVLLNP